MQILKNDLEKVRNLNEQGLYLQSYDFAKSISPIENWEGTEEILTISSIAYNLGAVDLSRKLSQKAWRRDKENARAIFYRAGEILSTRGILSALLFLRKSEKTFSGDEKTTAWWYSLHADIFSLLRDFNEADAWHKKAAELLPEEPWIWVVGARSLEMQDLYAESLEMSKKAFDLRNWERTTVQSYCHILTLVGQDERALEILTEASKRLENVWILKQLGDLQNELDMHEAAYDSFKKILDLTPIQEQNLGEWLYGSLSDSAYLCGDIEKSVEYIEKIKSPFHKKIKENLENRNGNGKRKLLKSGFIRQHQMTCAPATLTNISRFWEKPAEHLEVAEEISYNGTPAHKERLWAEQNGWATREFSLNWEDTEKLIDREIPFTLATVQPGNGHLQAVVGYDGGRKTVLIRDPFYRNIMEFEVEGLLEEQRSSGPRAMALVPKENAELLANLTFADSEQYDYLYRIESELEKFDREEARKILDKMESEFPEHRLTLYARWSLASYDANSLDLLETVERLREQFPDDVNFKLTYLSVSSENQTRDERLEKLKEFSKGKKSYPLIWQMFGYELGLDAGEHKSALRQLYKTARKLPTEGTTYRLIADILWAQRNFEDSSELYRFAACLNDKDERFAYSYFLAERHLKKTEKALAFLRDRFERFGNQSNMPAESLFHALMVIGRTVESFDVLKSALQKRPDDGELKLFAAEANARFGKMDEAKKLLEEAKDKAPQGNRLRKAALIEELQGNLKECLNHWEEIVKLEPLSTDAHENIAQMLSYIEGTEAAQTYLKKVTRNFPFNRSLHKLRLSYLSEKTTEAIAVLRHLIKLNPRDAWSQRELARWLTKVKKFEKAVEAAETAIQIDPGDSLNHWAKGNVLAVSGKKDEAAQNFKKALSLSIDADYALNDWIFFSQTNEEKQAILDFAFEEIGKQTNFGRGILTYQENARRIVKPEILLEKLRIIYHSNSDLWEASSVIVQQLVDLGKTDEALEFALQTTEKFPLIYQVWHDLSLVYKFRGENEKEIEALQRALEIFGNWSFGIQQLSEAFERSGQFEKSKELLEDAIRKSPLDHYLYGYLANALWRLDEKDAAIEAAKKAVSLEPDYSWAWQVVKNWSVEIEKADLAVELARELTKEKPKDARSWLIYARMLDGDNSIQEKLDALENALKLEPENVNALAIKANTLTDAGRFAEAIEVCQTKSDGFIPEQLRFVRAGIEAASGNHLECIRQYEELTKSSPDYYPAWERLAEYYSRMEDKKPEYLRVTRAMVRLAPQNPIVYGFLGEACLLLKKRGEAKRAFGQSIKLSPEYDYGGLNLFDLHFHDDELEECESVLNILKVFVKTDNTLIREIAFNAKKGDLAKTEELWQKLCFSADADVSHFNYLFEKFKECRIKNEKFIYETLRKASFDENANPLVGAYLIEKCWEKENEEACGAVLSEIYSNEKVWSRAMARYMELLQENRMPSYVTAFIRKNSAELQRNTDIWASTGYIYNGIGDDFASKNWFLNWESKENVKPWMLWNYVIVLRRLGEIPTANEVSQKALLLPADYTVSRHILMLALDSVHSGDYDSALGTFYKIDGRNFDEFDRILYSILETGLSIFKKYSEGNIAEAESLTADFCSNGNLEIQYYNDRLISRAYRESFRAAIKLSQNSWFKFKLKAKNFFAQNGF